MYIFFMVMETHIHTHIDSFFFFFYFHRTQEVFTQMDCWYACSPLYSLRDVVLMYYTFSFEQKALPSSNAEDEARNDKANMALQRRTVQFSLGTTWRMQQLCYWKVTLLNMNTQRCLPYVGIIAEPVVPDTPDMLLWSLFVTLLYYTFFCYITIKWLHSLWLLRDFPVMMDFDYKKKNFNTFPKNLSDEVCRGQRYFPKFEWSLAGSLQFSCCWQLIFSFLSSLWVYE